MVVRELLARLALDVDKKSFNNGDKAITQVKSGLGGMGMAAGKIGGSLTAAFAQLGSMFGVIAVAVGAWKSITLASDAAETMNVLDVSFKQNTQTVLDWAKNFGEAAGRSQYQMREMAGNLGAILNPMMGYNADEAARMSMGLTTLAVDLGSFYNATDDEALNALRSGIVGESEPLKKFGIVMLESTLDAYALSEGLGKTVKQMTVSEKTQLRYNYLMSVTKNAQGDAIKTADGFANASKGLLGGLRDTAVAIGSKVLPVIAKLTVGASKISLGFAKLVGSSKLVEAALIVLGGAFVVWGIKSLIASLPTILPFLLLAAAIGAAILVVDDFLTFLDGGESVIGDFINSLFGPGSAAAAAQALKEGLAWVSDYFTNVFLPSLKLLPQAVKLIISDVKNFFASGTSVIKDFVVGLIDSFGKLFGIEKLSDKLVSFAGKAKDIIAGFHKGLAAPAIGLVEAGADYLKDKAGIRKDQADEQIEGGSIAAYNKAREKEIADAREAGYQKRLKQGKLTQSDLARYRQEEIKNKEDARIKALDEQNKKDTAIKEAKEAALKSKADQLAQAQQLKEDQAYAKQHGLRVIPTVAIPTTNNNGGNQVNNITNEVTITTPTNNPKQMGDRMSSALEQASKKAARMLGQTAGAQ
jgi:hypothetical protein